MKVWENGKNFQWENIIPVTRELKQILYKQNWEINLDNVFFYFRMNKLNQYSKPLFNMQEPTDFLYTKHKIHPNYYD